MASGMSVVELYVDDQRANAVGGKQAKTKSGLYPQIFVKF